MINLSRHFITVDVYSKFQMTAIGFRRKMVQRKRRGSPELEFSLLMGAAAGEPAPAPPSLTHCLSPCPSPLPQVCLGLSGGDPPRETPTPTPSLTDPEEAEPRKGPRGNSRSHPRPHTRLWNPPSQGQPAPPCGSLSPPTSLTSVVYNEDGDEKEMETCPPSPTPSPPRYLWDSHSYHSSRPSPSLRSRATPSLVSSQPSPSLVSTRAAPSLVSRPSYSLVSNRPTPSPISQALSLASSIPSQSLISSPSVSPSPSSSPSPCPSIVQQDSHPPTSEGEEEESEQEGVGEEYTPPPTIHLVPNPRLHRAVRPHEGASRLPLPSPSSSASPPCPATLPLGSHPPTSEGEDGEESSSPHPHPHPQPHHLGEEAGRLWAGGCVQRVLSHSEGTPPRGHLPVTTPHSPLRGGDKHGPVYRQGPVAHRQLGPQPREPTPSSPPPPSCPPRPRPSLRPRAHDQEPGASVPSHRDIPRGPVDDARNWGSRFRQGRGEQKPPPPHNTNPRHSRHDKEERGILDIPSYR
ncbi:uncharacterized protein [Mobula birostris]|uniref:uncharacterized protein n=1 Tax=Mobula birostris TaxID=1983395 RepID=UPI003B28AEF3